MQLEKHKNSANHRVTGMVGWWLVWQQHQHREWIVLVMKKIRTQISISNTQVRWTQSQIWLRAENSECLLNIFFTFFLKPLLGIHFQQSDFKLSCKVAGYSLCIQNQVLWNIINLTYFLCLHYYEKHLIIKVPTSASLSENESLRQLPWMWGVYCRHLTLREKKSLSLSGFFITQS